MNSLNASPLTVCDACGGGANNMQPFASLVAGWVPTHMHASERYLVNICEPCFLVVLGDLRWRRRLNALLDDTPEDMSNFGLVDSDAPKSITFGEVGP